jgi:hypothetical protein
MIVKGTVVRQPSTSHGTAGHLVLENGFECDTLELPWKDNKTGISCTKADTYKGRVWWSPTMNRLVIRWEDKNGRVACLVHTGTWAGGAPEATDVHGCTIVGRGYAPVMRKDGKMQWGILNSRPTMAELIQSLLKEGEDPTKTASYNEVEVEYKWASGTCVDIGSDLAVSTA